MITKDNFKQVLLSLGFEHDEKIWTKKFSSLNCSMSVDFEKKQLIYPESIRGRERNAKFDAPENFVVFECVNRLLEKGYRPEHIILEKEWHLGHDAKSGRADICITNADNSMLLIIECKTYGKEYDNALKDTKNDGGQLFSYWQQEGSTNWLMLYTTGVDSNNEIIHKSVVIHCLDDENIILLAKTDKSIKLYSTAHTTKEKFDVWNDTYECKTYDDLIFSDDSVAYQIGVKPLRKKDLLDFNPEDSIVNQFEEILRHNNVSDKENAFNRLIALFICKLVDESTKDEDDEVEFQYKQGTDTYETLQDRLQRLHRDGMDNFMNERVFYIDSDYPEQLFQQYTGTTRKNAIEDLKRTIRCLKYYSNNDFAFKDVHNEELFYQNGRILVEMVQLFEKYRIVYKSKHQFLGDLFEQLLNKGFKQNEGQFFTPMPITRFIWDSLPIENLVCTDIGTIYPKVIDYACGAGHFLTEAIESINFYANKSGNNDWVSDHIYGIEKDYRLARVAKISLFMNGAGEGNIIFGDGLESSPDKSIVNGTFDILVANPPYSVKYFKQHLALKNNSFDLLSTIKNDGKEIEVLFVERIAQLLKPSGIAAVILPSSILSNDSNCYIGAREEFLKHFYIRAIVAFGSKTFGATGTNTVVMFLEKYNEPPEKISIMEDSVNAILNGENLEDWIDKDVFSGYTDKIGVTQEQYKKYIKRELSLDELEKDSYFKIYNETYSASSEFKNIEKTKKYQNMSSDEKKALYKTNLYEFIDSVEKDKLLYFSLAYNQKTVIIQAPSDNKEQKDFLGYDWSNRKGNEGIQINVRGGKLYNDKDRRDDSTLAAAIRTSFNGEIPVFTEKHSKYGSIISTADMLDFSRESFNKTLHLSIASVSDIKSTHPLKKLFEIATLIKGVVFDKKDQSSEPTSNVVLTADNITLDGRLEIKKKVYIDNSKMFPEESMLGADDIFICMSSGSKKHIGKVAFIEHNTGFYAGGFMGILRISTNDCIPKYLYYVLNTHEVKNILSTQSSGSNINNLSKKIGTLKIPVPPIEIQERIVTECTHYDDECKSLRSVIDECKQAIENIFNNFDAENKTGKYKFVKLAEYCDFNISKSEISDLDNKTTISFIEMASLSNDGVIENRVSKSLSDVKKGSYTYFAEKDIIIAKITPCMENGKCAIATGLENGIGFGSSEFHTLRCKNGLINEFLFGYLNRHSIREKAASVMTGSSGHRRVPIYFYSNMMIPILSEEEQIEVINNMTRYKQKIAESEEKLKELSGKTTEILNKYLY